MQTIDRACETRLSRYNWSVAATSGLIGFAYVVASGVAVDGASALRIAPIFAILAALYVVYTLRRPDPIVAGIAAALTVMIWTAGIAGIVSLTGLSFHAPLVDTALARIDAMLGFNAVRMTTAVATSPLAGQFLGLAYLSSFPLIFILTIYLGVTRRFRMLGELSFSFSATIILCAVLSTIYPAAGAFAHYQLPAAVLDALPSGSGVYHLERFAAFRATPLPVLSFSELQGVVTFPSFHTCLALMTAHACFGTRFFIPSVFWNSIVIVSTIPIGGHYVIDLFAGAALWALVAVIAAGPRCVKNYVMSIIRPLAVISRRG